MESPLIFTSKGNLPIASLEYRPSWELHADNGEFQGMTFVEEYFLDGESVKRAVHVYRHRGVSAEGQTGGLA